MISLDTHCLDPLGPWNFPSFESRKPSWHWMIYVLTSVKSTWTPPLSTVTSGVFIHLRRKRYLVLQVLLYDSRENTVPITRRTTGRLILPVSGLTRYTICQLTSLHSLLSWFNSYLLSPDYVPGSIFSILGTSRDLTELGHEGKKQANKQDDFT